MLIDKCPLSAKNRYHECHDNCTKIAIVRTRRHDNSAPKFSLERCTIGGRNVCYIVAGPGAPHVGAEVEAGPGIGERR